MCRMPGGCRQEACFAWCLHARGYCSVQHSSRASLQAGWSCACALKSAEPFALPIVLASTTPNKWLTAASVCCCQCGTHSSVQVLDLQAGERLTIETKVSKKVQVETLQSACNWQGEGHCTTLCRLVLGSCPGENTIPARELCMQEVFTTGRRLSGTILGWWGRCRESKTGCLMPASCVHRHSASSGQKL